MVSWLLIVLLSLPYFSLLFISYTFGDYLTPGHLVDVGAYLVVDVDTYLVVLNAIAPLEVQDKK